MSKRKPVILRGLDKLNAQMEGAEGMAQNAPRILKKRDLVRVTFCPPWSLLAEEDYILADSVGRFSLKGKSLGFFEDSWRVEYRFVKRDTRRVPHLASIELIIRRIDENSPLLDLLQRLLGELKRLKDWCKTRPIPFL